MSYTQEELIQVLDKIISEVGKFPTKKEIRDSGISDTPFYRIFGSLANTKKYYEQNTKEKPKLNPTTLVIPDAHVGPNQDLRRFKYLNKLILDKRPDNIIFMGDFVTVESLSNWDLNKAGIMEGRRYYQDIEAGREAMLYTLHDVKETYNPTITYLMGNHELRVERYVESKPELAEHINIEKDLKLKEFGIDHIIPYREYYCIEGVEFTHAPQNAANQACAGKYAIHRASELTSRSLVFAHTHRKECINLYRHGAGDIMQTLMCGAFFEHIDDYAVGGIINYWRGCMILSHWKTGRFDCEEFSLERLYQLY